MYVLRDGFLSLVLICNFLLFWLVSDIELALLDGTEAELAPLESDSLLLQTTVIHKHRPITYPLRIYVGTSIISRHLGGHAPPLPH